MKKIFCILLTTLMGLVLCCESMAQKKKETIVLGTLLSEKDSSLSQGRLLDHRLFMPKKAVSFGIEFSYFDINSNDSELFMLLQDINAFGTHFSVAPSIAYTIKDNKSIGLKLKYTSSEAGVSEVDMSLLSDDLALSLENVQAHSNAFQSEIFYRSYTGLDNRGRFGLFCDLALAYSHSKTNFAMGTNPIDAYTLSDKLKIAIHPGLEVFMMNNVSTFVSIGIGGISVGKNKYVKDGQISGTHVKTNARFKLNIADIAMGMKIHL